MSQRVHLDIQVGEHANNYAEIAAKDKLTELQLRVRQLVEQVDQIQKEQNYQRVSLCVLCVQLRYKGDVLLSVWGLQSFYKFVIFYKFVQGLLEMC